MKRSSYWMMASLCAIPQMVRAAPFDESKGAVLPNQQFPVKAEARILGGVPVDSYVVALAKATSSNIILDTSNIPTTEVAQQYPFEVESKRWKPSTTGDPLLGLLWDLECDKHLSEVRFDANTFLLWNKPDRLQTARMIVAQGKQRPADGLPDQSQLYRGIDEFIGATPPRTHDDVWNESTWRMELGKLPSGLGRQVKTLAEYQILRPDLNREAFFTDAYWASAHIGLNLKNPPGTRVALRSLKENGEPTLAFQLCQVEFDQMFRFTKGNAVSSIYECSGDPRNLSDNPTEIKPAISFATLDVPQSPTPFADPSLMSAAQLDELPSLSAKISMEVERQPLAALLIEAARGVKVKLLISPAIVTKSALVTACIQDMRLGTLMGALARTYDLQWVKRDEASFELTTVDRDALDYAMHREGRGGSYFSLNALWSSTLGEKKDYATLEQDVVDELVGKGTGKPGGFPFSDLSPDLQSRVKNMVQSIYANQLVSNYLITSNLITDGITLELHERKMPEGTALTKVSTKTAVPFKRNQWQLDLILPAAPGRENYAAGLTSLPILYEPIPLAAVQNDTDPIATN